MQLIRFLKELFIFIGALASAAAVVLLVLLMLRFPPLLIIAGLTCLVLYVSLEDRPKSFD
jgi:hypothetical protein